MILLWFQVDECEKAYLNMENVLIDDRRIHVDFCQSIATHKWNKSSICCCAQIILHKLFWWGELLYRYAYLSYRSNLTVI